MFGKQRSKGDLSNISHSQAAVLVSQVSGVYADLSEEGLLVKNRSSLPCPWFVARESFVTAYKTEYPDLPKNIRDSYHQIYRELSFFVDDDIFQEYDTSLNVAVKHRVERMQSIGLSEGETTGRKIIANIGVKVQTREEIWESLVKNETTCPRAHLLVLAETLGYCSELYRVMWDEWAAYDTFIAHQNRKESED